MKIPASMFVLVLVGFLVSSKLMALMGISYEEMRRRSEIIGSEPGHEVFSLRDGAEVSISCRPLPGDAPDKGIRCNLFVSGEFFLRMDLENHTGESLWRSVNPL